MKVEEPTFHQEMIVSPTHKEWMYVVRDEMDLMTRNKVWELTDVPPRRKSIENKWFFKIKHRADQLINKVQGLSNGERLYPN